MEKTRFFVDTNVILEANRVGCWVAICNRYSVETVEKCIEEVFTGNLGDPNRIEVDRDTFINNLSARHSPSNRDVFNLRAKEPSSEGLDDGELRLFAWLHGHECMPNDYILIATSDKSAIEVTGKLGWIDSLASLEQIVQQAGVRQKTISSLKQHYCTRWLEQIRRDIRLRRI